MHIKLGDQRCDMIEFGVMHRADCMHSFIQPVVVSKPSTCVGCFLSAVDSGVLDSVCTLQNGCALLQFMLSAARGALRQLSLSGTLPESGWVTVAHELLECTGLEQLAECAVHQQSVSNASEALKEIFFDGRRVQPGLGACLKTMTQTELGATSRLSKLTSLLLLTPVLPLSSMFGRLARDCPCLKRLALAAPDDEPSSSIVHSIGCICQVVQLAHLILFVGKIGICAALDVELHKANLGNLQHLELCWIQSPDDVCGPSFIADSFEELLKGRTKTLESGCTYCVTKLRRCDADGNDCLQLHRPFGFQPIFHTQPSQPHLHSKQFTTHQAGTWYGTSFWMVEKARVLNVPSSRENSGAREPVQPVIRYSAGALLELQHLPQCHTKACTAHALPRELERNAW
jgi:hypothetical protein